MSIINRPWAYQENADKYTHIIRGPNNYFVTSLGQDSTGISEDTARHIVLCANSHEALLAACQAMLEPFGRAQTVDVHGKPTEGFTTCPLCETESRQGDKRQHTNNCPIPIAEAAISAALPTPQAEGGENA